MICALYIIDMTVGVNGLREARSTLGITQAQAAELLGTRQANVSAYEQGRLTPGRLVAERIAAMSALATPGRCAMRASASSRCSAR